MASPAFHLLNTLLPKVTTLGLIRLLLEPLPGALLIQESTLSRRRGEIGFMEMSDLHYFFQYWGERSFSLNFCSPVQ